jgi:hypothetical protein
MALAPRSRTPRTRAAAVKETPVQETAATEPQKKKMSISRSTLVLGVLLVVAIGAAGYFYYQSKHAAQIADSKEIEDLTKTIGQFLELPTDETPTLATVTDREKLADQTFFLKAENGDKVLIYSQSGKAILYRPGTKKIVDMTSVNVNQPTPEAQTEAPKPEAGTPTPQAEAPQVATVALYNGGTKVGVTDVAEKQITAGLPGATVTLKEKAVKNDYVGTTVVDVSGKNGEKASSLASLLGGSVGSLPQDEVTPQADIVVIIGNTEAPKPTPVVEEKKN